MGVLCSMFDQAKADAICQQLADGVNLREICRAEGMPAWRTVYHWTEENPKFAAAIARARVSGYDAIAHETLEIADTPLEGVESTIKANGDVEEKRGDMLGHRKLQIETRLKLLAKWDPKRYGDKIAIGGDADNPLTVTVQRLTLKAV